MSPCTRLRLLATAALLLLSAASFAAPAPRAWDPDPFTPLTTARIAALPANERPAWEAYWAASENLATQLPTRPAPDRSQLKPMSGPPIGGLHTKGLRLSEPDAWYATAEAQAIADRVVAAQLPVGAWIKGIDYTHAPADGPRVKVEPTFDNDATVSELYFLIRVLAAAGDAPRADVWRTSVERGLRYIFAAQYPNGGFPQMYPLIGGYHDGITYNDDAMAQVLKLLRDVAGGRKQFAVIAAPLRDEAATRFQRGLACVLATQLRNPAGELTVWCQQYDPLTLRPAAARNFEPIADCSRESATLVLLLMSLPQPSPEVIASVEAAAAWFRATALKDLRIARAPADRRGEAVASPGAPPLWARFYEPGTTTPIFGDRDRTIHYDLAEVSPERIAGYAWFTDAPARVLEKLDAWRKKHAATKS